MPRVPTYHLLHHLEVVVHHLEVGFELLLHNLIFFLASPLRELGLLGSFELSTQSLELLFELLGLCLSCHDTPKGKLHTTHAYEHADLGWLPVQ